MTKLTQEEFDYYMADFRANGGKTSIVNVDDERVITIGNIARADVKAKATKRTQMDFKSKDEYLTYIDALASAALMAKNGML